MDDLELTKACAEAMGLKYELFPVDAFHGDMGDYLGLNGDWTKAYNPLHNDAQCFALVKRFNLSIDSGTWSPEAIWRVSYLTDTPVEHTDLNRAIVECVAKLHAQRLPGKE